MPTSNNIDDVTQPPPFPSPSGNGAAAHVEERGQSGLSPAMMFAIADPDINDPVAAVGALPAVEAPASPLAVPDDIRDAIASDTELAAAPSAEPRMGPVPNLRVTLPRGLFNAETNTFHGGVLVRELTGADEEYLARFTDPMDWYNNVTALGVTQIGGYDVSSTPQAQRMSMVLDLMSGEVAMIYLAIVIATFGDEKDFEFECQRCQAELELTLRLSEDLRPKLPEEAPRLSYDFTTAGGAVITYRPLTGKDEAEVVDSKLNAGEQNSLALQRMVLGVNGKDVLDSSELVRSLGIKDRQRLREVSSSHQPSIDRSLNIDCPSCGFKNRFLLGLMDLFRP